MDAIGKQTQKIEELLLEYEDACERYEFEKQKVELKVKLGQLVETKHAEYTFKKSMLIGSSKDAAKSLVETSTAQKLTEHNPKEFDRQKSIEKQKAYETAFLDQLNQYIQHGELEKPIAGVVGDANASLDDIQIDDSDLSTLSEFLGPEEMNSVLQAQASQKKKNAISTDKSGEEISVGKSIDENNDFGKTGNEVLKDSDSGNTGNEVLKDSDKFVEKTETIDNSEIVTESENSKTVDESNEEGNIGSNEEGKIGVNEEGNIGSDDEAEFFDATSDK